MSPFPIRRRPLAPPAGAPGAPEARVSPVQRAAHTDAPPRVEPERKPLGWGKTIGFGIGGGLAVAGLAAAAMQLFL